MTDIGDETNGLVSSAERLAEHQPLLGTAPPAMHLAMRLREAAGPAGLTGEVSAADSELASYHRALHATVRAVPGRRQRRRLAVHRRGAPR